MITGININESKKYISKLDPDKTNPTTFQVGVLDVFIRSDIDDQTTTFEISSSKNPNDKAQANINAAKRNIVIVRFGLRGFDNFMDPQTNKPAPFDTVSVSINKVNYTAVSDRILKMMPKQLIDELAEVIINENQLSGDEAKN